MWNGLGPKLNLKKCRSQMQRRNISELQRAHQDMTKYTKLLNIRTCDCSFI